MSSKIRQDMKEGFRQVLQVTISEIEYNGRHKARWFFAVAVNAFVMRHYRRKIL